MSKKIEMIRIDQIRILNPRHRDKRKFEAIVESIKTLGLKKPIQVSRRSVQNGEELGYDLVCGQGRMEAFQALGYSEIPAEVVEIPKEDCMLRSLVENMARRPPSAFALIQEIKRLKDQGYSTIAIAEKLGMADCSISALFLLSQAGEERLLSETMRGNIPLWVAVEISRAEGEEAQRELLKAYEKKEVGQTSIRVIRRLIEQRKFFGKTLSHGVSRKERTSAETMVSEYRRECQRQKLLIKKARLCDSMLVVLVAAFRELIKDEDFVNLLRAEELPTMPSFLAEKISNHHTS